MKKRFVGRSHQKRTDESRCTAAVELLYDVQVDIVHDISLVSGENGLSSASGLRQPERRTTGFIRPLLMKLTYESLLHAFS
ncbi:unnamed protein product [Protopolystoma xenopodis]|uniref:Uncharacterized protein n=1 Tax=Protopolystoma xenopodis TaxID=117903 RepID=A0A448XC83_9PLAT|nr:unnamed protein product [Protopolystoma xenopodis]